MLVGLFGYVSFSTGLTARMFMTLLVSHEEMSSLNVVSPHSLRKNRSDMSVISSVFHVEGWPWSRFGFRSVVPETPSVSLDASLTKPIQSWIHCFNSSFDCGVGTTVYLVDIIACSAFGFGFGRWEDLRKEVHSD